MERQNKELASALPVETHIKALTSPSYLIRTPTLSRTAQILHITEIYDTSQKDMTHFRKPSEAFTRCRLKIVSLTRSFK